MRYFLNGEQEKYTAAFAERYEDQEGATNTDLTSAPFILTPTPKMLAAPLAGHEAPNGTLWKQDQMMK